MQRLSISAVVFLLQCSANTVTVQFGGKIASSDFRELQEDFTDWKVRVLDLYEIGEVICVC